MPTSTPASRAASHEARYVAPALEKGLDILELLSRASEPLSQKEIAAALGRSPGETYRMLAVLEARRYLVREGLSGKYSLSLRLYHLAHTHSPWDFVRRAASGPMQQLAVAARQSCHLGVLFEDQLLILSRARSPVPVALSMEEGSLLPLLQTASGRVLLAFLEKEARNALLARLPAFVAMNDRAQGALRAKLAEISSAGFLVAPSDYTAGVTDISVPLCKSHSPLQAALTLPCLATTLGERIPDARLIEMAQECARQIQRDLGLG